MLAYLKTLALRVLRRGLRGLPPLPPDDPYVGVREPRRRSPGGRSSAVALAEPAEERVTRAQGRDGRIAR
jgi:hypothetical protein